MDVAKYIPDRNPQSEQFRLVPIRWSEVFGNRLRVENLTLLTRTPGITRSSQLSSI